VPVTFIIKAVVAVGAAVAAIAAGIVVNKRRQERNARTEGDVAQKLATATYELRDALSSFRAAFTLLEEGLDPRTKNRDSYARAYEAHWKSLLEAAGSFDMAALEAEALWGKEAQTRTLRLRMCVKLLHVAKDSYLADKSQNGHIFRVDPDLGFVTRDALAGAVSDDTNRLSTEIAIAVRDIEQMLESHSHSLLPHSGGQSPEIGEKSRAMKDLSG
jgi:hypothetical protein